MTEKLFKKHEICLLDKYAVLCIAGYHEEEEQFGSDVVNSFKNQFPGKQNIFFYAIQDNKGSIGGEVCEKVEQEIEAQMQLHLPELVIEIHHAPKGYSDNIYNLANLTGKPIKLDQIHWLSTLYSLRSPSDSVWYQTYVESQKLSGLIPENNVVNPYEQYTHDCTLIEIEAFLPSLESLPSNYDTEVNKTAGLIDDIVDSYRAFQHKLKEDDAFQGLVKRKLESFVEMWEIICEVQRKKAISIVDESKKLSNAEKQTKAIPFE